MFVCVPLPVCQTDSGNSSSWRPVRISSQTCTIRSRASADSRPRRWLTTAQARFTRTRAWIRASGIRSGDRVAVLLHNRPEAALAWLALARLGATSVPLNTKLRHDDAAWILAKSRAVALVTTPALVAGIAPVDIPVIDVAAFTDSAPDDAPMMPQ